MASTQSPDLINNFDELQRTHEAKSWWKRTVSRARLQEEFSALLEQNHADEEMLLGIHYLLESLMRLVSAEKAKYKIYPNQWPGTNPLCWQEEARAAITLVDLAVSDLATNPFYAGAQLDRIAAVIRQRATAIRDLSDDDAKKHPNYHKVYGNPAGTGGWKPHSAHFQAKAMALQYKKNDFEKELRMLMQESGATSVFKRFLGL